MCCLKMGACEATCRPCCQHVPVVGSGQVGRCPRLVSSSQQLKNPLRRAGQLRSDWPATWIARATMRARFMPVLTAEAFSSQHASAACNHIMSFLKVYCDADWSGNKQNRRSMSSGTYLLNTCCVHTSCRSQRCVSLSSTESKFYALVSAACEEFSLSEFWSSYCSRR